MKIIKFEEADSVKSIVDLKLHLIVHSREIPFNYEKVNSKTEMTIKDGINTYYVNSGEVLSKCKEDFKSPKSQTSRFYITKHGKKSDSDIKLAKLPNDYQLYDKMQKGSWDCSIIIDSQTHLFNTETQNIIISDNGNIEIVNNESNKGISVIELLNAAKKLKNRYDTDIDESFERINSLKNKVASIDTIRSLTEYNHKVTISKVNDKNLIWEIRESLEDILFNDDKNECSVQNAINLLMELAGIKEFKKIDYSDRFRVIKLED